MQEVKKHNVSFLHNRIAFTEKLPREEVRSRVAIVCARYVNPSPCRPNT